MRNLVCAVLILAAVPLCAATTSNNDSCDIGTYPAATLLLPYFEVTLGTAGSGTTTIFSVTNVSPSPQIARVTIWTDMAYPVATFNLFLTGYDVQPINLYDVIARGLIGGTTGTSTAAPNARDASGKSTNPNAGTTPFTNVSNPNFAASAASNCGPGRLPGQLPQPLSNDIRLALTTGTPAGSLVCKNAQGVSQPIGTNHGASTAVGYLTVDVVDTCLGSMPSDNDYWAAMLYDNVLTGDSAVIAQDSAKGNYAGGNPMVHIRALQPGVLPYTFYGRFTTTDRRQPLPSAFAARWISGTNAVFDTKYQIWREGTTGMNATCDQYASNASLAFVEIVRFDEHENAAVNGCEVCIPEPPPSQPALSTTSALPIGTALFPIVSATSDAGGWMYFNLADKTTATRPRQNWVVVSMFAESRFGVEYDATSLGNGCSPAAGPSSTTQIGPRP